MLVKILLDVLDNEDIVYEYTGSEMAHVYAVQMDGLYGYKEGVLYIRQTFPEPELPQNVCMITGNDGLYNTIQDLLLSYSKKETALLRMHSMLSEGVSLTDEMAEAAKIMENPCILLREDKKVIAWGGLREIEEFLWVTDIELKKICAENGVVVCEDKSVQQSYAYMAVAFVNSRGRKRYLVVIAQSNEFQLVTDKIFLKNVCVFLEHGGSVHETDYKPGDRIDAILKNMLFAVPEQKECIYEELFELGWKKSEKYYVLAVDFSRGKRRAETEDLKILSSCLNARVFVHENYYVCLFGGTLREEYDSRHYLGIEKWLEEKNYYAGLSYGLYDITEISFGYRQALLTISKSLPMLNNVHYYTFSDSVITYLVSNCGHTGELDLKHLCHPVVWRIYEYDREYNTDYINFLSTYIYSERSVKKTADVLYMHKNTVYLKINKLKDIFNLDVNDHYVYIKIYVSLVVIDRLIHSKDNSFIRWM